MFDWVAFLSARNIPYVTAGPNVSAGNIAVRCPFCGPADPSHHMSVALSGAGWRCWRNSDHRGRHPARLIAALLACSLEMAHAIAGTQSQLPTDFLAQMRARLDPDKTPAPGRSLSLPDTFRPFTHQSVMTRPYTHYLWKRNVTVKHAIEYGLHYCIYGDFAGRIIFPVTHHGRLVNWTGRAISPKAPSRYKTLATEQAVGPITDYLLWYDQLLDSDADTICLVEGPFDALNIMILGRARATVATALFTSAISSAQVALLHELLPAFERRILLLDPDAYNIALRTWSKLASLKLDLMHLPERFKDPGELDADGFNQLVD